MHKVLVIEDSRAQALILRQALVAAGFKVMCAEDGYVGIKMLQLEKADLVLTDIVMPNKEGLELILELRSAFPDIKIIAMSGNKEYLDAAVAMKANHTLQKPFEEEVLVDKVKELLEAS
jgi:DNA-binding response OmpR family regulator